MVRMAFSSTYSNTPGMVYGEFKLKVKVPASKACANDVLDAHATINYVKNSVAGTLTSHVPGKIVKTTIQVIYPWRVVLNSNGVLDPLGGTCSQYAISGNVIKYQALIIFDAHGANIGVQDLNFQSMAISCNIPNAVFANTVGGSQSSTPGVSINSTGSVTMSSSLLDAQNMKSYVLYFTLTIPPGTLACLQTTATMQSTDMCNQPMAPYVGVSKVNVVNFVPEGLDYSKRAVMQGNLPGCTGTWYVTVRNRAGNTQPLNYDLWDFMPDCVATASVGTSIPANLATTVTIHPPVAGSPGMPLRFHLTGTVPPHRRAVIKDLTMYMPSILLLATPALL